MTVLSTYFTSKPNPQKTAIPAVPNSDHLIEPWYNSVVKHRLKGIIFHDGLSTDFTERYPEVTFVKIKYFVTNRGLNDERFFLYREFLRVRPALNWMVFTDLFDVEFLDNPFKVIKEKNCVYVGSEPDYDNWGVIERMSKEHWNGLPSWWREVIKVPLNAGIIGGHRDIIIKLLDLMCECMLGENKGFKFFDMQALNYAIHGNKLPYFTGKPLHTEYRKEELVGGVIRHK